MNKVVLVTGATGGLGPEVVETFLAAQATLAISYHSQKGFQKLAERLGDTSALTAVPANLTDETEVKKLFEKIRDQHGRLDALCHITGGFWMGGDISQTPPDKWNYMMNLNLLSTFLCTRQAFRMMKEQRQGCIITFSAKSALDLPAGTAAYAVSKAGVLALTQVLAKEGKEYNIRVNAVLPSTIDTEENRKAMPKADFKKWVSPEEIARVLRALVNDELSGISGTAIKMYGRA